MNGAPDNKVLTGTLKNGQIMLDEPADWPEGCRLVVTPGESPADIYGLTEEEQSDDPEAIAKWLAEFDAIPPWQMTADEEAKWQADRQTVKNYTIAKMNERFSEARARARSQTILITGTGRTTDRLRCLRQRPEGAVTPGIPDQATGGTNRHSGRSVAT